MDDQGKYLRLFGTLFFTFIGFVLAFILVMLGIRLLFGLLAYIPWITYVYMIFILIVPATLFISIFSIYTWRTRKHSSKPARIISYIIFSCALVLWPAVLVHDMTLFFKYFYNTIDKYYSYDLYFLAANVAILFFTGILQALTTGKEQDWMSRKTNEL